MKRFLLLIVASLFLLQAGCGGGGGSSNGTPGGGGGGGGGGTETSVSGTASFGIIKNGTVKIYALNADGSRGALLATTTTNSAGIYSQSLGTYSGPVIAYAFGSYTDEATGATVTLTEANALRAALPAASGVSAMAVTGLTELAVRKAGSLLTASAITSANSTISSIFKVDITGVNPVEATTGALGAAGVSAQQRDYTLALAAMSQMASTASGATAVDKLANVLNLLAQGINSGIDASTAAAYTQALHLYLQNNMAINLVVANSGGSPMITVGSKTGIITVALSTPAQVYGANFTIEFPAGVTVHAQSDGTASNAVIGLTPQTANALAIGKFTPASGTSKAILTCALASGNPVTSGSLLILNADVAPGTVLTKDSFTIRGATFADQSGGAVAGTSAAVSSAVVQ